MMDADLDRKPRGGRMPWAFILIVGACTSALARQPVGDDQRHRTFLQRLHPVGRWNPDGRGVIHWWDPCCFPPVCGPDDYCRKPIPRVCITPLFEPAAAHVPVMSAVPPRSKRR